MIKKKRPSRDQGPRGSQEMAAPLPSFLLRISDTCVCMCVCVWMVRVCEIVWCRCNYYDYRCVHLSVSILLVAGPTKLCPLPLTVLYLLFPSTLLSRSLCFSLFVNPRYQSTTLQSLSWYRLQPLQCTFDICMTFLLLVHGHTTWLTTNSRVGIHVFSKIN